MSRDDIIIEALLTLEWVQSNYGRYSCPTCAILHPKDRSEYASRAPLHTETCTTHRALDAMGLKTHVERDRARDRFGLHCPA